MLDSKTTWVGAGICFAVGMAAMWGIDRSSGASATPDPAASASSAAASSAAPGSKVKVEMFVMSQCPYGVQAENGFKAAYEQLGDYIDLKLEFIGNTTPDGELSSMHGPAEVAGDVAQACAMKHVKRWFDFVLCQNKDAQGVATNWRSCADAVGGSADQVEACMQSGEGRDLVAASFKLAESRGASGSPTIFLNGKPYEGGRKPTDFVRAVCAAIPGEKPEACVNQAKPARVNVTILSDERCAECDTAGLEDGVRKTFADPVITRLDYGDAEAKKLFEAIRPVKLPAVVFDETLAGDPDAAATFAEAPTKGGHKVVEVGEFNPVCADPDGCKTDECKSTLACRAEEPKKLEVFVMSQCPYGVKGLDAMKPVLEHFAAQKETIDFQVHFIGDGTAATGLSSMHGPEEVAEDLREACAIEHYGKDRKFMDYVWCRNPSVHEPGWQACTGGKTGIDTKVIEKCSTGDEGKALLEKSFKYSQASGISASPTWLVNGKYQFSGIDPETIKKNLCAHNKLKGCDVVLSGGDAEQ